ncbi:MAG TPA: amino acid adenylation domain-containing protein [Candidatus Binataceae bacterium]|nr:amino acid adenylation domain-containing protein [Candidatus Binataceae bacterium]
MEADLPPLIHEIIRQQARLTPERTAAIFHDRALSYRELIDQVNRLSSHLRRCGVGAECVVGVCIERSLEMLIALIAVLDAGGAYLPLDPAFPSERIAFMISDSGAAAVVTQKELAARFTCSPVQMIEIDQMPEFADDGFWAASSKPEPASLAYLMYTSGSTGTPKGVMVEHRNVANFFEGMDEVLGAEPGVWLALTSISFDISVLELLWTLARGYTVVVQGDEEKLVAGKYGIAEQIRCHQVTHLQCTPTMAELLARRPPVMEGLKTLRKLLIGGEALPVVLGDLLSRTVAGGVLNMYGPTETTIWSTSALVEPGEAVTIGRPIVNTQIYIFGEDGRECPNGAAGEIYIGGAGVARGYWQRPELTAERFVVRAFGGTPARMYRTGDLGRYRPGGTLDFIGRVDQQIKLRGYRVELGEIEAVLRQHAAVAQAVVNPYDYEGASHLAAYIVAEGAHTITDDELRVLARRKLPEYMVPSVFVFLPELPATQNGKIDRKALPPPDPPKLTDDVGSIASATIMEKKIAGVLGDALGIPLVGLKQNFFDMGATSLIVAEAAVTLREVLNLPLKITDLFAHPTVSALASFLGSREAADATPGIERGNARRAALARRRRAAETAKDQS